MQAEDDGPGTDSSWTPWKTLHHQSQDLSPWLTEGFAIENLRESPPPPISPLEDRSTAPSTVLEELEEAEPWISHWRRYWKVYALLAGVICLIVLILVPSIVLTRPQRKSSATAPSSEPTPLSRLRRVQGIATFNDYAAQSTVCYNANKISTADNVKRFAAAAGDISKDISPGLCEGSSKDMDHSYNTNLCIAEGGQAPLSSYQGPACRSVDCGTCFRVDNMGPYGSTSNDIVYGSVIVEIVDACPASHAANYCQSLVPADQRCGSSETNSLDIDAKAYRELTSRDRGGGMDFAPGMPNLRINITLSIPCDGTI